MSKPRLTSQNITTIIIAVIGVVGTVTVAYFSFREKTAPIELAIITTQTAEARQTLLGYKTTASGSEWSKKVIP